MCRSPSSRGTAQISKEGGPPTSKMDVSNVGWTVGVSLIGIVLWGTIAGSMLPFLLRRAGLDPATSSAPFVATLVDVTGLVIYFSVGLLFLKGTLL